MNFITKYTFFVSLVFFSLSSFGQEQPREYIFFDCGLKIRLDSINTHEEKDMEDPFSTFQDNTFFGLRSYYSSKPMSEKGPFENNSEEKINSMSDYIVKPKNNKL